ncbi:MAG: hypothetical protein KDK91_07880 [Gammaproteobacteria bacterium]|nr:hypothetical protein [Gammaproteobacteria bacterium]
MTVLLPGNVRAEDDAVDLSTRHERFAGDDWRERPVSIPEPPRSANLARFDEDAVHPDYRYYLDTASLSSGEDGVIRYTVVVESGEGVRNVFYEGLRCRTNEVRLYAYAGADGRFREPRRSDWQAVMREGIKAYQLWLAEQVLCGSHGLGATVPEIKRVLAGHQRGGGQFRSPNRGE